MSNKTRNILKITAVIIVLITVLMHLNIIGIPAIAHYKYWMVVIAFCMVLISSR